LGPAWIEGQGLLCTPEPLLRLPTDKIGEGQATVKVIVIAVECNTFLERGDRPEKVAEVIWSCNAKRSERSPSKVSAQSCPPEGASASWALMRIFSPTLTFVAAGGYYGLMKKTSVSDLKNQISRYLDYVKHGETV
jgi:hypothetical protein